MNGKSSHKFMPPQRIGGVQEALTFLQHSQAFFALEKHETTCTSVTVILVYGSKIRS